MIKKAIIVGIGILLGMNLWSDFATDFQSAVKLYNGRKNEEAQKIFMKLAAVAPTAKSKAESMVYAALSLSRQKKYDEAIELAKKIEIKPVSINCQMDIMFENKKYKEIVAAFKDEDISVWPDYCIWNGFYKRGMSNRFSGNLQGALKDAEKLLECSSWNDERSKITALSNLGDIYKALKEESKALDTYLKASAMINLKGLAAHYSGAIGAGDILGRQGKYDEALTELQKIDLSRTGGIWKFQTLKAYGNLYDLQGKKDEALAKYKEALSIEKIHPALVSEVNKKVKLMEGK